jgi:HEAT repeat protein
VSALRLAVPAALLLGSPALAAGPPRLAHTPVESRPATGHLATMAHDWAAAQTAPAWLGYEVPATGNQSMCCCDSVDAEGRDGRGGCRIEEHGSFSTREGDERPSDLDDDTAIVLLRAEQGRIGRVRVLSRGCAIDAGGRTLTWVDGVTPPESLGLLASLVSDEDVDGRHRLGDSALMAIAVHAAPRADDVLQRFLDPARPVRVRKQAAFWMGTLRGRRGYEALSRLVREDPSDEVRAHVVFALGQSKVPEAVDAMIRAAREDPSAHVRGQALFWLGQKAGARAVSAITRAIDDDPETDVKKKAVFALSQLPRDEGVPRLIEVARTNRNREVRKQAMFWLGQSGDPRALAFFEMVLARPDVAPERPVEPR